MFNSSNRQFVLKQSSGKLWNFFYDEKRGLQYTTLTKRNTWVEPVTIHKSIFPQFCAEIDENDRFHILFQDNKGNIAYSILYEGYLKTFPVLNSKTPSTYDKYLNIIPLKNTLHFFYVLQYKDSYILAHQTLQDGRIEQPKVVDYVTKTACPYSVVYDSLGTIYAFFQAAEGEDYQIGYKRLPLGQTRWSEFNPVTNYKGGCQLPRALIDRQNIIHLCYQRITPSQYELVYRQKVPDKNIWTNETAIYSSSYSFDEASLLYSMGSVIIYWVKDDYIYYSLSKDGGSVWSRAARYNFPVGKQLMCLAYSTNDMYEKDRLIARDIPGSFINGLTFAFYQEAGQSAASISPQELKDTITDTLKMLKGSIDDLNDQSLDASEKIQKILFELEKQEKELVKLSVKLGFLENEINRLKTSGGRIESFRSTSQNPGSVSSLSEEEFEKLKENSGAEIQSSSMQGRKKISYRDLLRESSAQPDDPNGDINYGVNTEATDSNKD